MTEFDDIAKQCDAIEECYEFMLAYAAQGLTDDRESRSGTQLREMLGRAVAAVSGLTEAYAVAAVAFDLAPAERYTAFLEVLRRDVANALAALELVLVQPRISSQLIDNLNASLHLRTLLTDVFLLDEIVRIQQAEATAATGPRP
jgi:phage gp29-like protein